MPEFEKLIEALTDPVASSYQRRTAVGDLARSDDPRAVEPLVELLGDEDQYLRREVVVALGRLGFADAVDPLVVQLGDSDDYVRREAALALGELGVSSAVEPLKALSDDPSYLVRDAAKTALTKIEKKAALGIEPRQVPPQPEPPEQEPPKQKAVEPQPRTQEATEPEPPEEEPGVVETREPPVAPAVESASTSDMEPLESPAVETPPPIVAEPPPIIAEPPPPVVAELVEAETPPAVPPPIRSSVVAEPKAPSRPTLPEGEFFAVRLAEGVTWDRAERMRLFYGDDLDGVREAYQRLDGQQQALFALEEQVRAALADLNLQRADKGDDLAECETSIDETTEQIETLEHQVSRAMYERRQLDAQVRSLWHGLVTTFSSDAKRRTKQRGAELDSRLMRLNREVAEARQRLGTLRQQHDELSGPFKKLQTRSDELATQRAAVVESIAAADREIDAWTRKVLRDLLPHERDARFQRLGERSYNAPFFKACAAEFAQAMVELHDVTSQLEVLKTEVEESEKAAGSTTEGLAGALTDGFQITSTDKRAAARLSGSVRFQEESGFFSGYSGASGSASGSGTGEALYSVDQVEWEPGTDLHAQVARFTEAFQQLGEKSGQYRTLCDRRAVCERAIAEFVHLVRSELERDLVER